MKQFLKFTLASCLGVCVAFVAFGFISMMIVGGIASSLSTQSKPSISEKTVLEVKLSGQIPELTNNARPESFTFQDSDVLGLHDIVRLIEAARDDDNIVALKIANGESSLGLASLNVIGQAINDFKESGKPVVAYGDFFSQKSYLLASYADHIIMSPAGGIDFRGFGVVMPFFTKTLDNIGIDMQVYYAGDYKGATEPFRLNKMSEANRSQMKEYIFDTYGIYLEDISKNRGISPEKLEQIADRFELNLASDAIDYKMVDMLGYSDNVGDFLRSQLGFEEDQKLSLLTLNKYKANQGNLIRGSANDRIAVLYAEGELIMGKDEIGTITEKRYLDAMKKIADDDDIKAVVLRVNSPGGSVLVAEHLLHGIKKIQEKGKPIVVSMGDVAASGGYYISCSADEIFVQPNTVTGSIGVFGMIPNVRGLLEDKIGLTFDTLGTGPYATRMNAIYEFDKKEDEIIQEQIDFYYNDFLEKVAKGRNMSVDEVHKVAQGRIWTGERAVRNGLADEIGGLTEAITRATEIAEIESYKLKEFPRMRTPIEQLMYDIFGEDFATSRAMDASIPKQFKGFQKWVKMFDDPTPQARMLYEIVY